MQRDCSVGKDTSWQPLLCEFLSRTHMVEDNSFCNLSFVLHTHTHICLHAYMCIRTQIDEQIHTYHAYTSWHSKTISHSHTTINVKNLMKWYF